MKIKQPKLAITIPFRLEPQGDGDPEVEVFYGDLYLGIVAERAHSLGPDAPDEVVSAVRAAVDWEAES